MDTSFFLKGDICWSASLHSLETVENGFLLCLDGKSGGVFREIPAQYASLPVKDFSSRLIIPGLTDLHIHAPQFAFRALGMDLELLDWLNKHAFPEETKYSDPEYALEAYRRFVDHVKKGPNTRLSVYATIHTPATLLLMDMLEESGLVSLTGKVNMDRNCPAPLMESDAAGDSGEWLEAFFKSKKEGRYKNSFPILTPRFIPGCSDELMNGLREIQMEYELPIQSHLSENLKEVEWVRELCPNSQSYAAAYSDFGLLGGSVPTIMAHCVWTDEKESDLLAEKQIYVAHCPQSNINLSSGIAPVRRFLDKGIPVGLGSDVAGGAHTSIFRAMSDAIQVSKLRRILVPRTLATQVKTVPEEKALTLEEAFYMGTAGGGSFFGKIKGAGFGPAGSFKEGWDFDALVIDDRIDISGTVNVPVMRNLRDRLEQVVYLSDDRHIVAKFVRGIPVF